MESSIGQTFFPQRRWRHGSGHGLFNLTIVCASHSPFKCWRDNFCCTDSVSFRSSLELYDYLRSEPSRPNHRIFLECKREPRCRGPPEWVVYYVPTSRRHDETKFDFEYGIFPAFSLTSKSKPKNAMFYVTKNLDWLLYGAYLMSQNDSFYDGLYSAPLEHLQHSDQVYRDLDRKYKIDEDLCKLTGQTIPDEVEFTPEFSNLAPLGRFGVGYEGLDEDLLKRFVQVIKSNIEGRTDDEDVLEKFSGYALGDIVLEPQFARYLTVPRKQIPLQDILKIIEQTGCVPAVGCMGKISVLTSDGKIRAVYPMHLGYEALLRYKFRRAQYNPCYHHISRRWDFRIPPGKKFFELDVVKCDKQMWQYLKAASDILGWEWLLPFVRYNRRNYEPGQMPSGIYGTDYLTNWFVTAALDCTQLPLGCELHVQGDAVFTTHVLELPIKVRVSNEENVLNGFRYSEDEPPVFLRTHKILSVRGARKTPAKCRYAILYASYKYIRAVDIESYARYDIDVSFEGKHYTEWDHVTLGHFCNFHKYPLEINIVDGLEGCSERSNWDSMVVTGALETMAPKMLRRVSLERL